MVTLVKTGKTKPHRNFGATPEGKVKQAIFDILITYEDICIYCPVSCGYSKSGIADFVVCYKGFYLEIEAKAARGKQSKLQSHHQKEIEAIGGTYLLIYPNNLNLITETLTSYENLHNRL